MDSNPRRRFAEELRSARELHRERRLTQTDLARMARTSKSTISRVESGKGPIPPELPSALDQIFRTEGSFKGLYDAITANTFAAMHQHRVELERKAISIGEWSQTVVPGLLQTPDYARAIIRQGDIRANEAELTAAVQRRIARQEIFHRASPPELRVVLCESVLHRSLRLKEVMRDQLALLLTHMERPTTRIRVLPFDSEPHPLICYDASFLTSPKHVTVACIEAPPNTAGVVADRKFTLRVQRAFEDLMGEALPERQSADLIQAQMERLS
ncbi:helix-turn-helix domain-containing protein [Streptomyces sp. NPDC004126]|uniref:helix-turn-helix domain-containing protein n=1 Tax=Streptomyces sp. NPDC004126 TaxID=3390695 RepID=UPI003CFEDD60